MSLRMSLRPLFHAHPGFVGHEDPKSLMGKKSDQDNIQIWTKELGLVLKSDESIYMLNTVTLKPHDIKRVLTRAELRKTMH